MNPAAAFTAHAGSVPDSFERQPPQDLAAEQSVLGAMLLSKDAIADVVETLRAEDFYRPAHQLVFDCILDLYGGGEPADAVTLAAELQRRGHLIRIGGAPYLHTLIASAPTAANAGYYAEIVAEKAVLRRLVEATQPALHRRHSRQETRRPGRLTQSPGHRRAHPRRRAPPYCPHPPAPPHLTKHRSRNSRGLSGGAARDGTPPGKASVQPRRYDALA